MVTGSRCLKLPTVCFMSAPPPPNWLANRVPRNGLDHVCPHHGAPLRGPEWRPACGGSGGRRRGPFVPPPTASCWHSVGSPGRAGWRMIRHLRFHGRGGEGVKLASRIVSRTAFLAG